MLSSLTLTLENTHNNNHYRFKKELEAIYQKFHFTSSFWKLKKYGKRYGRKFYLIWETIFLFRKLFCNATFCH